MSFWVHVISKVQDDFALCSLLAFVCMHHALTKAGRPSGARMNSLRQVHYSHCFLRSLPVNCIPEVEWIC